MTNYVLEVLEGDRQGEVFALGDGRLSIGRKPTNTLAFKDEKLSSEHCEIRFEEGHYVLVDAGSTNGTWIDGRRITEVVLAPFDVFVAGRTRLIFKAAGAPNPGGDDLQLHRLDDQRLAKSRRRGVAGLVGALVLVGGIGAWLVFGGGPTGGSGGRGVTTAPEVVAGNLLAASIGACESTDGFELDVGGGARFELGRGRTGTGSLEATANAVEGAAAPTFGLCRTQAPVGVQSGGRLRFHGWVRTFDGGLGAVRLELRGSAAVETDVATATVLVTGATATEAGDWQRVSGEATVPVGYETAHVQLLALLPQVGARVQFDDIALVMEPTSERQELAVAGRSWIQAGHACAMVTVERPLLLSMTPAATSGPLRDLAAAGLASLGDLGGAVATTAAADGFDVSITAGPAGLDGLRLAFASDAVPGGVLARSDAAFATTGTERVAGVREFVLGQGATRLAIQPSQPMDLATTTRDGRYLVTLTSAQPIAAIQLKVAVVFSEQKLRARGLLNEARSVMQARPGAALDLLAKLVTELPFDDETLREATALRADLLTALGERFEKVGADLVEARFFDARTSYDRVRRDLDRLLADYGEHNIPEAERFATMREEVAGKLGTIDAQARAGRIQELDQLATLLEQNRQPELGALVRAQLERLRKPEGQPGR